MKVYKIINIVDRKSIVVSAYDLTYPKNKWVKPKVGKIFCFKKYIDASNFLSYLGSPTNYHCLTHYIMVAAEAKNVKRLERIAACSNDQGIKVFWENNGREGTTAPEGTYTCSEIKCLQ